MDLEVENLAIPSSNLLYTALSIVRIFALLCPSRPSLRSIVQRTPNIVQDSPNELLADSQVNFVVCLLNPFLRC